MSIQTQKLFSDEAADITQLVKHAVKGEGFGEQYLLVA